MSATDLARKDPSGDIRDTADPAETAELASAPPVPDDAPIEIRFLAPAEAEQLSRCIWRSYGATYDADWVYRPAEIARRMIDGTFRSLVAVTPRNQIVGHLGLSLASADALVGEGGQAVVDPRYRGHHVFTTLKKTMAEHLRRENFAGMFSEATAAHPYSQRANVALGAQETGILVGYIPASVEYKDIDGTPPHRRSVIVYYLKTSNGPPRPVYAPPHHRAIVREIVERAELVGTVVDPPIGFSSGPTKLSGAVHDDHNTGFVTVDRVGEDLGEAVGNATTRVLDEGVDCVYVDLPLADPGTARHGDQLRDEGFLFGGLFPNLRHTGDVLRLQFLDDLKAETSDIELASEAGNELLAYVLASGEESRRPSRPDTAEDESPDDPLV